MIFIIKYNELVMKNNRIRLTESQLNKVIKESIKQVLKEGFGDKTFNDAETQDNFRQDIIDMFAGLDDTRFMRHFNNRHQIDDPDVLDALWQEYVKRNGRN